MRAAIYARMSTDKQSADSPADQVARCRDFAAARGWHVVEDLVVTEAGISGASRHNRPGLLELVARIAEWDVLVCFEFTRLARDSEDLGWIRNRMRVAKRTGYEASTGLDVFNVGAKVMGVLGEEYLVKLRADVQRGLRGRVERKLAAGAVPYGYRTEPVPSGQVDPHGRAIPAGYRIIVEPGEAAVVRGLFERYAAGEGLRVLAHRLNAKGIRSPRPRAAKARGASWAPSTIREMLRNPLYRGELVWNRSEWIKDHETGKRRRHERPESEWLRQHDEAWRIVSDAAWQAAQRTREGRGASLLRRPNGQIMASSHRVTRARHLLSGFLECGACGGGFFAMKADGRYGCGWHRDRGADVCASDLVVARQELEERVVGAVRERILTPANVAYAVERALAIVRRELAQDDPAQAEARLAALDVQIERAVDLAVATGRIEAATRKIGSLRAEREALAARMQAGRAPIHAEGLRPELERRVRDLRAAFAGAPEETRAAFRLLLAGDRMQVHRDAKRAFRVEGVFHVPLMRERPGAQASGPFSCVVAGGGFEPPTSGL